MTASFKAIAMNKVGDYGLTLGLVLAISLLDSTETSIVNSLITEPMVILFLLIAAAAKSAQVLLHH